MAEQVFRVTTVEYQAPNSSKFGVRHTIVLPNKLSKDYFVQIQFANENGFEPRADHASFMMSGDPYGTGDMYVTGGDNVIELFNGTAVNRAPRLLLTVVECLAPESADGFRLRDVVKQTFPSIVAGSSSTLDDSMSNVVDPDQLTLHGYRYGGGAITASDGHEYALTIAKQEVVDSTTFRTTIQSPTASPSLVFGVTYAVEWGSNWSVQRKSFSETMTPGSPVNTGSFTLDSAVNTSQTMLFPNYFPSGATEDLLRTTGAMFVMGDGSSIPASTDQVTIAAAATSAQSFDGIVQTVSNPALSVSHEKVLTGSAFSLTGTFSTPSIQDPRQLELKDAYPDGAPGFVPNFWVGNRILTPYFSSDGTSAASQNSTPVISLHQNSSTQAEYGVVAAEPDNGYLWVYGADLSAIYSAPELKVSDFSRRGTPGLKSVIVRELFKNLDLVNHCEGRIVGTHEQVRPGDGASSVKMPRVIVEAISGNQRYNAGIQTVLLAIYCYSRNGYSDAARMYEMVTKSLQHCRLNEDGYTVKGIIRETERPHDGHNEKVDGYYLRGLFTFTGTM